MSTGINMLHVILSKRWRSLSKTQRLVMISLISRAKQFHCWPSFNEIAGDTGLKRRAVMRTVSKLSAAGHIIIWKRDGMRNKYSVSVWRNPDQCLQNTLVRDESTSVQKIHGVVSLKDTSSLLTHCITRKAAV
jgi:hypothetical protein